MKVYYNNFWTGFLTKENPIHIEYFQELFKKVFGNELEVSILEDADILVETVFGNSVVDSKEWKYSFLYSGESYLTHNSTKYSAVLCGKGTHLNFINCPLFQIYTWCNYRDAHYTYTSKSALNNINAICCIISNPNGKERNRCIERLEEAGLPICFAGSYKNNMGGIFTPYYNRKEYLDFISQFCCVLTMENSEEDTYITEKLINGCLSSCVPIYWGSKRVEDYINKERFINIQDIESDEWITKIKMVLFNESIYKSYVEQPIYPNNKSNITIDTISSELRRFLFPSSEIPVKKIYTICKEEYEPVRYNRLKDMKELFNASNDEFIFQCPTWKHTITDNIFNKWITGKKYLKYDGRTQMRKSELSLYLNLKSILEDIKREYRDGIFLIFESDVVPLKNWNEVIEPINILKNNTDKWYLCHLGYGGDNDSIFKTSWREPFTQPTNTNRFIQKLHTRCTDTLLWTYNGVCKMLKWFEEDPDFSEPMDHYICSHLEKDSSFIHIWSLIPYFVQTSNYMNEKSEIQSDKR